MDALDFSGMFDRAIGAAPIVTILYLFMMGLQRLLQQHHKHLIEMLKELHQIYPRKD